MPIIIDDTITTGTTLKEAHKILIDSGVNVLFGLDSCWNLLEEAC